METGNNSSDCGEFDTPVFKGLVIVQAALSDISCCCILVVLVLVLLLRRHQLLSQRRALYLVLSSLASSIVTGINVVGYQVYRSPHLESYCTVVGFLNQLTNWWVILAICCIMVDVSLKLAASKSRHTKSLELLYVTVTFVSPLLLNCWIPFVFAAYGSAGPVCWIKYRNETGGCQEIASGFLLMIALYFIPVGLVLAFLVVLLLTILASIQVKMRRSEGKFDSETQQMKRMVKSEIRPLLIYPTILIITSVPDFVLRAYAVTQQSPDSLLIVFWYLTTSLLQLQGALYSLAFLLQRNSSTGTSICTDTKNCCNSGYQRISDYPITESISDSIKGNENETMPLNSDSYS